MNCTRFDELVDDFLDGELDQPTRQEAERHVADCAACRRAVEELRSLLREAAALPREIEPPRDLFPSIRHGLDSSVAPAAARQKQTTLITAGWLPWGALAASLLVLSVAVVVVFGPWQRGSEPATPGPAAGTELLAANDALAEFRAAEEAYVRATRLLLDTLEEQGGELSPQAAAVIEENLAIIDRAIDEVRVALADDPGNRRNGQVLNALHRQKLQLLMRAQRLSS